MGTSVWLGNPDSVETVNGERRPLPGNRVTTIDLPAGWTTVEALTAITHPQGIWTAHSNATAPDWVASTDDTIAAALAGHYNCPTRTPSEVPDAD